MLRVLNVWLAVIEDRIKLLRERRRGVDTHSGWESKRRRARRRGDIAMECRGGRMTKFVNICQPLYSTAVIPQTGKEERRNTVEIGCFCH